jgi:hypothetical protein
MSNQKITAVAREALWIAHARKCAYTHELVDLSSMHVDHIIPEKLADLPEEWAQVRTALGLTAEFDLFGLENLLPAKAGANLQKHDLTMNQATAHFFLAIARAKKSVVESNIERIERRIQSGRAFIVLQQLMESGQIHAGEVAALLSLSPGEVFRLVERMQFADKSEVLSVSKAALEDLKGRPIRLGSNDHIDGVILGHDTAPERAVRTCAEYEAALEAGYYARSNYEIKMSVFFEHQCGLLTALAKATLPVKSYMAEPRVGLPDLHLLPFSMFPSLNEPADPPSGDETASYQQKVDSGDLIVRKVGTALVCVEEREGMGQHLVEVVRADFDGDGLEDMLVFEYCYATHGTLGFGGIKILSRRSSEIRFDILSL